jgi:ubiquinol-cytochrome c reductase cytochrome c subunit
MNVTAMNVILSSIRNCAKNLLLVSGLLFAPLALAAGSAEKGKTAFVKHGCWQCHGFVGQGAVTGPKLAPNPIPPEAFSAFVRFSAGGMPPYQKAILSDEDLADIHAYLQSQSKAPDYKSIPLLNP